MIKKNLILALASFLIFFLLVNYITYPLIFNLGSLSVGLGDELVIAWIQNSVIHALFSNPFHIFDTNLYFPYHNTLAFSETFITTSILSIIPLKLAGEPISTVNFTLISSLILLGFSIYLLCFYLTKDFLLSVLGGILVIFSPMVLDKMTHLQILAVEGVPLSILFFLIFLSSKKSKYFAISLVFFLLQTYNSFMPGYFILFSYFIIFIYSLLYKKTQTKKLINKKNIFIFIFALLLVIPIALPYYQVSKEFNYKRDIKEAVHLALQPEDLLYPSTQTRLQNYLRSLPFNQVSQNNEFKPGYLGFVFTILAIISIWYFVTKFRKKDLFINSFSTISLLGLLLSLGPVLHLGRQTVHLPFPIPLPYIIFYYVIPGFQGLRNSSRWEMLFIICIAVVITLVLYKIFAKYSSKTRNLIYFLIIAAVILEFNFPIPFVKVPQKKDFPKVYRWLNSTPQNSAIILMPAYNWNMKYSSDEILRSYYSTVNFRKSVNGYSGFFPTNWQNLLIDLQNDFPNESSVTKIKNLGVDYIIIDRQGYDKNFKDKLLSYNGDKVIKMLKQNSSLKLIKDFGNYTVFKPSARP